LLLKLSAEHWLKLRDKPVPGLLKMLLALQTLAQLLICKALPYSKE